MNAVQALAAQVPNSVVKKARKMKRRSLPLAVGLATGFDTAGFGGAADAGVVATGLSGAGLAAPVILEFGSDMTRSSPRRPGTRNVVAVGKRLSTVGIAESGNFFK